MIQLSASHDEAVKEACQSVANQVISVLQAKYGFDIEEAKRVLNLDDLKLVRKPGPVDKKATGKKAKDPNKPKKAQTAHNLFTGDKAARAPAIAALEVRLAADGVLNTINKKTKDVIASKTIQPKHIVTEMGRRWMALSLDEKAAWQVKADELKRIKAIAAAAAESSEQGEEDEEDYEENY